MRACVRCVRAGCGMWNVECGMGSVGVEDLEMFCFGWPGLVEVDAGKAWK